jgi:predicted DNA-binding transcriptional regulator YafY
MRRADRLFQIVQMLRRSPKPVTADAIAVELETSKRSVYRDIAALMGQRVPIRGEAGIGYVLEGGFDMPPLMLTSDEIEAAVLGAQWVASRGDPALARAARDLIAKIAASVPERLRPVVLEPSVTSARRWADAKIDRLDMAQVRTWIRRAAS